MVEYKCTHKKICVRKLPIKIMCHLSNSQNKLENRDRNTKYTHTEIMDPPVGLNTATTTTTITATWIHP
jgi:hypothetical protein